MKLYMFRAVPQPIIIIHSTLGTGICHAGLKTAFEQDQDGTDFHPGPARKLSTKLYDICQCRVYSE